MPRVGKSMDRKRFNHQWIGADYCQRCGLRREGYSGGRTGTTRYWRPSNPSAVSGIAGPCVRDERSGSADGGGDAK